MPAADYCKLTTTHDACTSTCYGKDNSKCNDIHNSHDCKGLNSGVDKWSCDDNYYPVKSYGDGNSDYYDCCFNIHESSWKLHEAWVVQNIGTGCAIVAGVGAVAAGAYGIYLCAENDCLGIEKEAADKARVEAEQAKIKAMKHKIEGKEL